MLGAGLWLLGSCAVDVESDEGHESRALPVVAAPAVAAEDVASAEEIWRAPDAKRCGLVVGGIQLVSIRAGVESVYFEIRHESPSSANALEQEAVVPKAEVSTNAYATKHTPEGVVGSLTPGSTSWIGVSKAALGKELKNPGQIEVSLRAWGGEVTARLSASASGEWAYVPLTERDDIRIDEQGVHVLDMSGVNVVVGP